MEPRINADGRGLLLLGTVDCKIGTETILKTDGKKGVVMSMKVGKYEFEGPYSSKDDLNDESGVYAIHCRRDDKYYLIDIGESDKVKSRIKNHEREDCWKRNCTGTIFSSR